MVIIVPTANEYSAAENGTDKKRNLWGVL